MPRENKKLAAAKSAQNDEFYTQYNDIEKEVNAYIDYNENVFRNKTILLPCDDPETSNFTRYFANNFQRLGIKKLISTSYVHGIGDQNVSLFDKKMSESIKSKHEKHGKIFVLDGDTDHSGRIDIKDLKSSYLKGDGDFASPEVKKLRDEADIIITNPPFSLFHEFLAWINEANKKFLIIGNINCLTYQDVFTQIKQNKCWLGTGMGRWISGFIVPPEYKLYGTEAHINEKGQRIVSTNNCLWLTNLEHGKRHEVVEYATMRQNLKYNHKLVKVLKKKYNVDTYPKYDNYDAIEIPYSDAIPADYVGAMGVPITYLDKYNPDQFEILGIMASTTVTDINYGYPFVNGKKVYARILIKNKHPEV